jgi:hypothetical protein
MEIKKKVGDFKLRKFLPIYRQMIKFFNLIFFDLPYKFNKLLLFFKKEVSLNSY